MKFPKLKNALLCRILVYVVVLSGFIAPGIVIANLRFIREDVRMIAGFLLPCIAILIYIGKNFILLMAMDIELATLHCRRTARKRFALPPSFGAEKVKKRILKFGKPCAPTALSPAPQILQYKSDYPWTEYSRGIEKVIAVYDTDFLDRGQYHSILRSATANTSALKGKKKHRFLDKSQKKSPLNRVTVIFIFAERIEEGFRKQLFRAVCRNGGDGFDTAILPCIVDAETGFATFDSERIPYVGFQYPVKNRGIRFIRKRLFRGRLPFANSPEALDPIRNMDTEQSLWSYWRDARKEWIADEKVSKKRHEKMKHKELIFENGSLYLKWENRGVRLSAETDEKTKTASVDAIVSWDYPKSNRIAKATAQEMQDLIRAYFAERGYTVSFRSRN